eukprot:5174284-Pyramimonas_sp.AAC.1
MTSSISENSDKRDEPSCAEKLKIVKTDYRTSKIRSLRTALHADRDSSAANRKSQIYVSKTKISADRAEVDPIWTRCSFRSR